MFCEELAPHLLQIVEHSMELLFTPGRSLDSFELEWVPSVSRLSNLVDNTKVEEALL